MADPLLMSPNGLDSSVIIDRYGPDCFLIGRRGHARVSGLASWFLSAPSWIRIQYCGAACGEPDADAVTEARLEERDWEGGREQEIKREGARG